MIALQSDGTKVIDPVLELVRHIPSFSLFLFENNILDVPKE